MHNQSREPRTFHVTCTRATCAQADIEMMIQTKLTEAVRKQEAELARLKRESREGFATVHETVANMNKVIEGKRTLLEEQLRKELAQLRKMVVLI